MKYAVSNWYYRWGYIRQRGGSGIMIHEGNYMRYSTIHHELFGFHINRFGRYRWTIARAQNCKSLQLMYDRVVVEQMVVFDFEWSTYSTSFLIHFLFRRGCLIFQTGDVFALCVPGVWLVLAFLTLKNNANLRDLIAATGLVILLEYDSNRRFFSPWEIWWITSKNNRTPLLCRSNLCASFQSHGWI